MQTMACRSVIVRWLRREAFQLGQFWNSEGFSRLVLCDKNRPPEHVEHLAQGQNRPRIDAKAQDDPEPIRDAIVDSGAEKTMFIGHGRNEARVQSGLTPTRRGSFAQKVVWGELCC